MSLTYSLIPEIPDPTIPPEPIPEETPPVIDDPLITPERRDPNAPMPLNV